MHISAVMCILKFYLKNICKKNLKNIFLHWQIAEGNQPIFLAANVLIKGWVLVIIIWLFI